MPTRDFVDVNGVRLSYVDFGGSGQPLLALHGHYGCARSFAGLAAALGDRGRIIAIDQRGHGWSDHPADYSREAYLADTTGLVSALGLAPAFVLGHSLGALNAYELAAHHPELVRAMVIEDLGAVVAPSPPATQGWPTRFASLRQLLDWYRQQRFGADPYFLESVVEWPDGWGFRFDYDEIAASMDQLAGDWWADWLGSAIPALLLHGHRSWVLPTEHAREMAARRPNTRLVEFPDAGHTVHDDALDGVTAEVAAFLLEVS
jgi:esterase